MLMNPDMWLGSADLIMIIHNIIHLQWASLNYPTYIMYISPLLISRTLTLTHNSLLDFDLTLKCYSNCLTFTAKVRSNFGHEP